MQGGGASDEKSEAGAEIAIGPHVVRPLADDVVRVAWNGDVLAEHVIALGQVIAARPHGGRGVFLLQDHTRMGRMTADARRQITKNATSRLVREVVVFGASFHLRVVITMIHKAMNTIRPQNAGMTFFDTEAEALSFIDDVRRRRPQGSVG